MNKLINDWLTGYGFRKETHCAVDVYTKQVGGTTMKASLTGYNVELEVSMVTEAPFTFTSKREYTFPSLEDIISNRYADAMWSTGEVANLSAFLKDEFSSMFRSLMMRILLA
jgi:hypothetical protein